MPPEFDTTPIVVLTPLEAARKRPGMYVGDTRDGSGLAHMVWELVSNSLDEHMAGHCSRVTVEIEPDGSVIVEDDGRGIRVADEDGRPFVELSFTQRHQTPTRDGHAPHEHVGLWGMGLFVICALSETLKVEVRRDGRRWTQRFSRGEAVSALIDEGPATTTGTRIQFLPDPQIFAHHQIVASLIERRLRELSYLVPGFALHFRDQREHVFHEPRGLMAQVESMTPWEDERLEMFSASGSVGQIKVDVAACWTRGYGPQIESYANIHRTTEGGTHVDGLARGLVKGLRVAAPELCSRHKPSVIKSALTNYLKAVVCVKLNDPAYGAPTKDRLVTKEAANAVEVVVAAQFSDFLSQHPEMVERIAGQLPD